MDKHYWGEGSATFGWVGGEKCEDCGKEAFVSRTQFAGVAYSCGEVHIESRPYCLSCSLKREEIDITISECGELEDMRERLRIIERLYAELLGRIAQRQKGWRGYEG
jgi:hypothetical protein